jgi:glycosyltransferase involved in cell wall biosynthesis
MRILLLNQFFYPDHSAVAQLAGDLAEDLVAAGHQVTALAAKGGYLGGAPLPARETWRGIDILRVGATTFGKRSLPGRLADYATFYLSAAARSLLLPRFDAVIATTAPPLVATLAALLRAARGSRFVYWVQDVYPDLAVQFGVLHQGSPVARCLEALSRATLHRADAVVVLGDAMASRIVGKGVPSERVHVLPNWADGQVVRSIGHDVNPFRREHGLEGKTVVLYSGNMGRGHEMATLLDAIRRLRLEPGLVFAFIGDGARRAEVEAAARELSCIRLLPYQARDRLHESLSAGDVHVVSQDPGTLGLMEPSKLYGVMAAGRPVLYIGPSASEVARTVLREDVGKVVACGDSDGAARAIVDLAASSAELGARARAAFEQRYDRQRRTARFCELISGLGPG